MIWKYMRFIEVKRYFWGLEAMYYSVLPRFVIECKAEFLLKVSENEVVLFSKFMDSQGLC
jgi:hypothetical protein